MTSQLTTKDVGLKNSLNPGYTKVEKEDRIETFMIDIFMIREVIKIDMYQIVEMEGFNLVVEYNMDRITEVDQGVNKIKEMTIEEVILERM